jgi:hypothetical protein
MEIYGAVEPDANLAEKSEPGDGAYISCFGHIGKILWVKIIWFAFAGI